MNVRARLMPHSHSTTFVRPFSDDEIEDAAIMQFVPPDLDRTYLVERMRSLIFIEDSLFH